MMKYTKLYLLVVVLTVTLAQSHAQVAKKPSVKAQTAKNRQAKSTNETLPVTLQGGKDSLSYALGMDIASSLKSVGFDVDLHTLAKGLEAVYQDGQPLFEEAQVATIIQQHIQTIADKKNAELRKPGEEFLAALKNNPAVKSTPEGVLYEVLVAGQGEQPTPSDEVKVHYTGYLIDGEKFDSSYDRGEPMNLSLNRVIEGWKICLPLMKVGAKYKLYIPYHLAYGERATGKIPAFSTLIFEIELLDIVKRDAV